MTFPNRNQAGSGGYARSLVATLQARDDIDVSLLSAPADVGFAGTMTWLLRDAAARLRASPPALLHCPSFVVPWRVPIPYAVTVFDLSTRIYPRDHPAEWRAYERLVVPGRARGAALVIAISEVTRRDVIARYGVDAARVLTIYPGIDEDFGAAAHDLPAADPPTLLFPGAPLARKNLDLVLRCMAAAREPAAMARATLQISGATEARFPRYANLVRSLGLSERVRWLGQVPREDMPGLMSRASVLVYPSFYEGFGLPPLEAMAAGTPVVASNASCLPEVLGDAAVLVDPGDQAAFTQAVEAVLTRPELRQGLVEAGRRRAAGFTWRKCADETLRAYRRVVSVPA